MSLKDKAVGHYNIPASFLKNARHIVTPYLLLLIQFSFDHDIFPSNSEIAGVVPFFKVVISILTCFSKIFEKLI